MGRVLDQFDAILSAIEKLLAFFAAAATLGIVLITTADVAARYGFNSPISGTYEIVSYYLMPVCLAFAFPICYRYKGHIKVEFFRKSAGPRAGRTLDRLTALGSFIATAAIAFYGLQPLWDGLQSGEVISGTKMPMWPAYATVPIAFGVLAAGPLVELLSSFVGRPLVSPGSDDGLAAGIH